MCFRSFPINPEQRSLFLRNGWMEQRSTGEGVEYRMTEAGLTELSRTQKPANTLAPKQKSAGSRPPAL
jgi:hypothetical protein